MKKLHVALLCTVLLIFFIDFADAQPIKGASKSLYAGYGISQLRYSSGPTNHGFNLNAELAYAPWRGVGLRAYSGWFQTGDVNEEEWRSVGYIGAEARFFYMGAKIRIAFPFKRGGFFFLSLASEKHTVQFRRPMVMIAGC